MPSKSGKPRIKRVRIQQEYKEICIATNCGQPRKHKIPANKDPRFIRPKKVPKSRKI